MGDVSDRIKAVITPAIGRILHHPFLVELKDRTLPHPAFARCAAQNSLYPGGYARVLSLIAARLSDPVRLTRPSRPRTTRAMSITALDRVWAAVVDITGCGQGIATK